MATVPRVGSSPHLPIREGSEPAPRQSCYMRLWSCFSQAISNFINWLKKICYCQSNRGSTFSNRTSTDLLASRQKSETTVEGPKQEHGVEESETTVEGPKQEHGVEESETTVEASKQVETGEDDIEESESEEEISIGQGFKILKGKNPIIIDVVMPKNKNERLLYKIALEETCPSTIFYRRVDEPNAFEPLTYTGEADELFRTLGNLFFLKNIF